VQLFLAFVVALSITAALIPVLARLAPSIGLTDPPGPRKVHAVPVPRVGGLAMAAGLFIATLLTVELSPAVRGLLLGLLVLVLFGLWDDRVNLGYGAKFVGQVIAVGICMVSGGIHVGNIALAGIDVPPVVSALITFVFLIGITNAINLADGLDGLAGGMALLCLCAIALFSVASGQSSVTAIALIEAGAVLGFLRFNTHPARVFMGDCGSQMLGLSVGALALLATQGDGNALSAALPLLLLGLPIMDTLTVMLTRIRAGRSPFSADATHLHHRLLSLGFAHREAVLLIYILQVGLVLLAYFLRFDLDSQIVVAFCTFAAVVLGLLRWATASGWRLRQLPPKSVASTPEMQGSPVAARMPALTLVVMVTCLLVYAMTIVVSSGHVGIDLGLMCLGMLVVLLLLSSWRAERTLSWFERAAAYCSVVVLVYLDQTMPHKPPLLTTLSWTFIGITGAAAFMRFWVSPTRRFELTTLDVIVIFIAIVLPNLPGSIALPADLPGGVAKAVILLYVVEILLTFDLKRVMPRLILFATLAMIAGRALFSIGA
jgi:UDP-GlcNAc:undecaprenyl-phosphate GlcNAc-1-phosphate transferase